MFTASNTMLAHLSISVSLLASLVLATHYPNQVGTNGPTSPDPSQIFQERVSIDDNVWFDIKTGGEQFYDNERIGWRLKNDDGSAVIHKVLIFLRNASRVLFSLCKQYNMSDQVVTCDGMQSI